MSSPAVCLQETEAKRQAIGSQNKTQRTEMETPNKETSKERKKPREAK